MDSWQVISPVEVAGYVVVVDELLTVQNKSYEKPTILVAKSVKGEEEIPDGTVAVLTPDMPDVLSYVSVRARNSKEVASDIQLLMEKLEKGEFDALTEIRRTVLQLAVPPQLVQELKETMKDSGMPWPGDEGEQRWEQAWTAIKKVWASKWNERSYFSTRKAKLDHDRLCMAVLIQEIISADYAFVIHTTNPSTGHSSEIYAEGIDGSRVEKVSVAVHISTNKNTVPSKVSDQGRTT